MVQRPIHLAFALALAFLLFPTRKDAAGWTRYLDWALAALSLVTGAYVLVHGERFSNRVWFVDEILPLDFAVGAVLVLVLLETTRRVLGNAMLVIALVFLGYALWGGSLPGLFAHRGISPERLVELMFMSPNGIFGSSLGVSADYVFYFVLFAAFLEVSGGGQLFIDMAEWVTGRSRGGPAKAAVVGSALFGTISGSAVANVAADGIFTIPLMKRAGYAPHFAGAVEAVASTGGQLMPPVMGAAAFLMADMLGVPYSRIVLAAIVPSIIYYGALFIAVDLKARRERLRPYPSKNAAEIRRSLVQRAHLLLPLVVIVYFIMSGYTGATAAFWAIVACVVVSLLRKATRLSLAKILEALESGARQSVPVAIPCAVAGIVVGTVVHTGLGLKFSALLTTASGGNLMLSLVIVMLVCIVLGMGMPTTAAYIVAGVLMAPALIKLGVIPLAAHMFVFYFALLSMVTPPVALAAYAAAGIAKADLSKTGWTAFFLAIPAMLVPFAFVLSPALLFEGPLVITVQNTATALVGAYAMAAAIIGYQIRKATRLERVLLGAGAVCLIDPGLLTDVIGVVLVLGVLLVQRMRPAESPEGAQPPIAGAASPEA
jgi:TRAP transporter 4TM/12TM fusion protein